MTWTYADQQAHRYLRREIDWFLWALDNEGLAFNPRDRRPLHPDAAAVHAAVMGQGEERAHLIFHFAATGDRPETSRFDPRPLGWGVDGQLHAGSDGIVPRPLPIEPTGPQQDYGRFEDAGGNWHNYVIAVADVIAVETEEYERAGRKKMRRVRPARQRHPVEYCPIEWRPSDAYIEMANDIARKWELAIAAVEAELAGVVLRAHVLAPRIG